MQKSHQSFFFEEGERAVIFFHAFTSNPIDVRTFGRSLSKLGYSVYAPLFQRHGHQIEDTITGEAKEWFDDGTKAVDFMKSKGYQQVACFGVSLGGMVATYQLLNNSNVIGGGPLCSPMIPGYSSNTAQDFWLRYHKQQRELGITEGEINSQRSAIDTRLASIHSQLDDYKRDMVNQLKTLKHPIFIAQGGKDTLIDPEQAKKLVSLIPPNQVTFRWYEEGGHVLTIGSERSNLLTDMEDYLNTLPWFK